MESGLRVCRNGGCGDYEKLFFVFSFLSNKFFFLYLKKNYY